MLQFLLFKIIRFTKILMMMLLIPTHKRSKTIGIMSIIVITFFSCLNEKDNKHLFILSGQSNMKGLDINKSFIPTIIKEFGKKNIILVKYAENGKSIDHWIKKQKSVNVNAKSSQLHLYDILIEKIHTSVKNQNLKTITFIWMQGESDAKKQLGKTYEKNLINLYHQICDDLNRKDINFIIGRLNDFDMLNKKYPHWTMIRDIQTKIAESNPRFDWVNTDDLNNLENKNNKEILDELHMTENGYKILGKRFANKAINRIQYNKIQGIVDD